MNKFLLLLTSSLISVIVIGQVEIPEATGCKVLQRNGYTYCVDSTYQVVWTASKIFGKNIAAQRFAPPDSEFFRDIPRAISATWKDIEKQVKFWSIEFDSLYVVTGRTTIEVDSLTPPKPAFFKAILKGCQGDAIGFIAEEADEDKTIEHLRVSIDKVEDITGMNFFSILPTDLQEIIESEFDPKFWPITDFSIVK